MNLRRLRRVGVGAWLGVLALGMYAIVPIRVAFDIVAMITAGLDGEESSPFAAHTPHAHAAVPHNHGQTEAPGERSPGHQHSHCAICGALPVAGAVPVPAAAIVAGPIILETLVLFAVPSLELPTASPAAYVSRAPPGDGLNFA